MVAREVLKSMLFGGRSATRRLGRYRLVRVLGEGGMGVVFHGHDEELSRSVALKVLHDHHAAGSSGRARLLREARAMAQLSHPNVVQVYEVGTVDDQAFVAMELVEGRDLDRWRAESRRSWRECVHAYLQAGQGLAAAHAAGLVHRDFKPSNCIIDDEQRVRVLDFGLVRERALDETEMMSESLLGSVEALDSAHDATLTRTGAVLGTLAYMPPEQMQGREADARSDQFSFCVSLYEAAYGLRPYAGRTRAALLASMAEGRIEAPPRGARAPARLRRILARGLAAEPEQRWPSMDALLDALRSLVTPRRGRWIAASMAVVGAGLGIQALRPHPEPCTGARARLDGVWDDARRRAVEEAVLDTALPYAPGTWERVEPWLDDYADAWVRKHTEVCEATAVHHEQSEEALGLRMACLDRRRVALRATVEVLAHADAMAVEHAVALATGLPGLTRCDDLDWLVQHDQRMPPPEDPAVAQQVEELRERLAAISATIDAGQYARALQDVEPVVRRAEGLGYDPLLAEAVYWQGRALDENGRYPDAERALEQAHALALRSGHDDAVLHATQALTSLVGYQLARHAEGLVWGKAALPLAERTGDDAELGVSWNNLGSVHRDRGDYEQARDHHQRALQAFERAQGEEHPRVAGVWNNLGNVLMRLGEYEQAEHHYEQALRIWEQALDPEHPDVAIASRSLGNALLRQGRLDQAEPYYRRALRIVEASLGPEHPDVAMPLE
ncbi:MAG: tetratricopeptide repeat protein, partial [Myxococcales bacterium]|nr:tetratricopeptide repeat protein [Myxococcales bacterium]